MAIRFFAEKIAKERCALNFSISSRHLDHAGSLSFSSFLSNFCLLYISCVHTAHHFSLHLIMFCLGFFLELQEIWPSFSLFHAFFSSSPVLGFAYLVSVPKAVNLSQIIRHSSSSSICAQVFCVFLLCLPSLVHLVTKAAACLASFS